jgi:3-hydroxyisobutyrate dehydrogenase
MRVAVLGTGIMGAGMARSLLRAGIDVTVWNRHIDKAQPLAADGARVDESSSVAVRDADVVLTMPFDESAVREVAEQFLPAMPDAAIWMQCATVGPAGIRRLADLAAEHDRDIVDAPVVGTRKPAEDGTLAVLVSGAPALLERLVPVSDAIGSKTVNVGESLGAASGLKLACNAWVASITAGAAQSLALCSTLGVDPRLFLATIDGSASNTPYAQLKGGMMIESDFTPSFEVDGLVKDLGLMLAAVESTPMSPALLATLRETFGAAVDLGHGRDDIAAVITAFHAG